jgi:hypothetical protein
MTDPARVGDVLPGVLAEVVDRAGQGYDRWMELVAQAGYCHHPIRLAGRVEHADRQTGEVRQVYDSKGEPDGVLLKACGTRRGSRCPSCATTYRADACCYDAEAQVLWNALAPELWRRTTIAVYRTLGRLVGLQEEELRRLVRIPYAKVAEFQRRGAIHFHAVLRLDAATDCRCAGCLAPPDRFTAALLEQALREAVAAVGVPCPPLDEGPARYAR